jgi:hypothetical protein
MAVERCSSCGQMVDLDYHVEGIIYVTKPGNIVPQAVCPDCLTDDEFEQWEAEGYPSELTVKA